MRREVCAIIRMITHRSPLTPHSSPRTFRGNYGKNRV